MATETYPCVCPHCGKPFQIALNRPPVVAQLAPVQLPAYHPQPAAPPEYPHYPNQRYQYALAPPTNGWATAGLCVSLFGIFLPIIGMLSIVGIILSIMGLVQASSRQNVGSARAGWGLAIGIAGLIWNAYLWGHLSRL